MCPGNVDGIVTFLIDNGTYVNEGDVVCIIEDNNQQNNYDNLQIALENATAELSKVNADLKMQYALLEAQVKNNEVDTEIAHLDSLQLTFATPTQRRIKELELERAYIEKAKFEQKLNALDIINQSEIRKLEINIQQLSNRLESAEKILEGLTIRAPKRGLAIVSDSRMTGTKLKVGDNVWNNMPVVMIPEVSEMKVKMAVNETDFKYISENDSVAYSFDAMPGNRAHGRIIKKLPVGQPYKRDSKVKFFEVEASIDSVLQLPEPGFTANSRVITTYVNDTIVIPQIAIYEVDSMKVVYVRNNKKYEIRQIATGPSSMKEAIVTTGLKKGEVISLIKPPASFIRGKKLLSDSIR
ncbi:efflux RND transporter periplasmic adaptor subunit [uncultured Proteiniphilum sp.]|uniref:efflux RND transporter periplasmic adaptor subunit n=1 Tax=uncultured Proteiniphilum sp. TaxID=497637 RepID=UPI002608F7E9|nr:efflux RND transporter periplasmic adaptor subunit [uncultured Proteiniphilum sp.]